MVKCLLHVYYFTHKMFFTFCRKHKWNKINAKSLTTLRQKYRKYAREYETDLAAFRANPDAPDSESEMKEAEDEDSDFETDMDSNTFKKESSTK